MKRIYCTLYALGILLFASGNVYSDGKQTLLIAHLQGFREVPSVSTGATGEFRGRINPKDNSIDYELTYSGIKTATGAAGAVNQAHIHIGQRGVNGGIVLWFCQSAAAPGPAGTPDCTSSSGHFTGTFTSANVVAIGGGNVGQQVGLGEIAKVIAALRAGVAYVNVHTPLSTGGEIRGQVNVPRQDRD
jgi:hypothetical protein